MMQILSVQELLRPSLKSLGLTRCVKAIRVPAWLDPRVFERIEQHMKQGMKTLTVNTQRQGLVEITDDIRAWVNASGIRSGLLTVFCRHTSASLLIQENAAPEVRGDIERYFARIAPEDVAAYAHGDEGPDDMPAHLRTALTQVHLSIPVMDSRLALGTWQGIYLFEHRRVPHRRSLVMHLIGEE